MSYTTFYVTISYLGARPETTTVTDAYKMYSDLGGTLKSKAFSEKIKEAEGVSLGFDNGNKEAEITFTADLLTKNINPAWNGISTLVDVLDINTELKQKDYEAD
jgi:hypothetical protein